MLIDKSELLKAYDEAHNGPPGKARGLIEEAPGVEAVPLDKLCEWLAKNAFAFECKDCEEYCRALLECENDVGSDPEYWKNKLAKWMEEQDATD